MKYITILILLVPGICLADSENRSLSGADIGRIIKETVENPRVKPWSVPSANGGFWGVNNKGQHYTYNPDTGVYHNKTTGEVQFNQAPQVNIYQRDTTPLGTITTRQPTDWFGIYGR